MEDWEVSNLCTFDDKKVFKKNLTQILTSQSIFITGGGGYVGAMLVPRLLQEGHQVTVLDLMIYGKDVLPA